MKNAEDLAGELDLPLSVLRAVARVAAHLYWTRRSPRKRSRLLRTPLGQLAEIQQAIKGRLLDKMALPDTMHGWRKGHDPRSYVAPHVGHAFVLNIDVRDFFPSVTAGRVCAFWERQGYNTDAARLLTALTTCDNQLPQGAPTSQSIGNQILVSLNNRLHALAIQNGLTYSNFADEVSLSGGEGVARLQKLVLKIIGQEGFATNPQKVKLMRRDAMQCLTGIVINKKASPGRENYRALRALVNNCVRYGPATQPDGRSPEFKERLRGRIGYLSGINDRLGRKLRAAFDKIIWPVTDH